MKKLHTVVYMLGVMIALLGIALGIILLLGQFHHSEHVSCHLGRFCIKRLDMMSEEEIRVHLRMGEASGRQATCGMKINYKSEAKAGQAAAKMSVVYGKMMEGYPCFFCDGWHVGREMTAEEREQYS